jgi:hypothetical protein
LVFFSLDPFLLDVLKRLRDAVVPLGAEIANLKAVDPALLGEQLRWAVAGAVERMTRTPTFTPRKASVPAARSRPIATWRRNRYVEAKR